MSSRTRTINTDVSKGSAVYKTGIPISGHLGVIRIGVDTCTDIVRLRSQGDCQYFDVIKYHQSGGRLNGTSPSANFSNFYGTVYDSWSNFPHHTILPGSPSDTAAATAAAARTNPSRPYVDVAAEVLQLADIALLIRNVGRSVIKNIAKTNLNYQFGIQPLVGDLFKLSQFGKQLDFRMKELDKLKSERGFRRTLDMGTYSASGTYWKTIQSQGILLNLPFFANTVEKVRVHTRWMPSGDFNKLDVHSRRLLAIDAMIGNVRNGVLGMDLSTLWEALPWTWLIDWGGSVGQYFTATRNIVPATLTHAMVMRETTTDYSAPGGEYNGVRYEPVSITRTDKHRKPGLVAPTAHFPLLDGNQMGILASLAVLRR